MKRSNRLMLITFAFGMPGVAIISFYLPQLIATQPLPMRAETVALMNFVQGTLLLLLSAWAGSRCAPRVRFSFPLAEAIIDKQSLVKALSPQLAYGIAGGVLGFLILFAAQTTMPTQMQSNALQLPSMLPVKILYGGITEEILLRFGVMSSIAAGLWSLCKRRESARTMVVMIAIGLSALLFALGHLPAAMAFTGSAITSSVVAYVMIFNTAFGLVAGALYWKRGLDAAIIAHVLAHVLVDLVL